MTLQIITMIGIFIAQIANAAPVARAADFEEGTETELSVQQLDKIKPWATNSLIQLRDLLDKVNTMTYRDAHETMVDEIKNVVLASAPKKTELLLRFILNRAMKVNDELATDSNTDAPGAVDTEVRILRLSVELAQRYYTSDIAFLDAREKDSAAATLPYAAFGLEYANMLMTMDQSMFGARAQYAVARLVLGFLQVDLNRDEHLRFRYAPAIGKIHAFLTKLPERSPDNGAMALKYVRQMRKTYEQALALINAPAEK